MVPSGIMYHWGASVFLDSLVFLAMDLGATIFFLYIIFVVLLKSVEQYKKSCITKTDYIKFRRENFYTFLRVTVKI